MVSKAASTACDRLLMGLLALLLALLVGCSDSSSSGDGGESDDRRAADPDDPDEEVVSSAPRAPELVGSSSLGGGTVTLEWKPAHDEVFDHEELEYHIHLSEDDGFTPDPDNLEKSVTGVINATVEDLEPNTPYFARLVVENPSGRKAWSNQLRSRTGEGDLELKDDVQVRTDAASKEDGADSEIELTDDELFFSDDSDIPEVGDYVASGDGEGYLVRVAAVEAASGGWIVTVEDAALNEVYESIDLQTTVRLDRLDDVTQQAAQGIRTASSTTPGEFHWEETGLSIYDPRHPPQVASGGAVSVANDRLDDDRQNIKGDGFAVDAPGYVSADPQEGTGSFTVNITQLGDYELCAVGYGLQAPESGQPEDWITLALSGDQLTVDWAVSEDHIDARGRPYTLELEARGHSDCSNAPDGSGTWPWSSWDDTLSFKIPLYVAMGEPGFSESEPRTISVGDDFTIVNEVDFSFVPSFDIGARIAGASLQSATLAAGADMEFLQRLTLSASMQASIDETVTLLDERRFTRVFVAGGVPIVVSGSFSVDVRFDGDVSGEIDLTEELNLAFRDARFGLEYANGTWNSVGDFQPEYEFSIDGEGEAGAEVRVTLAPSLTVSFYEAASGRMLVEPYGYADAGIHGHFSYESSNGNSASELDYHFTKLEAGGGVDLRLFAGLSVWDLNIASFPSGAHIDSPQDFHVVEVIEKKPFAGIPELWIEQYLVLPPDPVTGNGRVRVQGAYAEVSNPFYSLFGLNPAAFIEFQRWLWPAVTTSQDNYSVAQASNGASDTFELHYRDAGDYSIRLAGHSNLGWFVRQVTEPLDLSLGDPSDQVPTAPAEHVISWGQGSDATGYNVYISTESGCDIQNHESCQNSEVFLAQEPPFSVPEAYWDEDYYVTVEAELTDGSTARFPEYGTSDVEPPPVEDPVLEVEAGDSELEISWEPVAGASDYNLYYSLEQGFDPDNYASYDGGVAVHSLLSPHTETGLENGTVYYLVLEAVVAGQSFYSAEVESAPSDGGGEGVEGLSALNDTGIDWCADGSTNYDSGDAALRRENCDIVAAEYPGQDGMAGRDAAARDGTLEKVGHGAAGFDFTKLDADGNDLPASAADWSCVRDNHTGLLWEVKTTDGGLRDRGNRYSWYQPDGPNGGDAGTPDGGNCEGSECDTHHYVEAVNEQGLCGANDWRLPTVDELHSITHLSRRDPAIDEDLFPNTSPSLFWSASPYAGGSGRAWQVSFRFGVDYRSRKFSYGRVRLVRGGQ